MNKEATNESLKKRIQVDTETINEEDDKEQ